MIGYKFFQQNHFLWRKHFGSIIPLTLPHIDPKLSYPEARNILKLANAAFIRWETDFGFNGTTEWWHIIKSGSESFESLPSKCRSRIKKAQNKYDVTLCNKNFIIAHGYKIYQKSFERYKTFERCFSEQEFKTAISDLPSETEFWGVFDKNTGNLVAFAENLVRDNACFYVTMWLNPESMKYFSGYVLFHEMNKYYLNERKLSYVSDGARNISHATGVHNLLIEKFKFRKAYCKLHIIYKPWLSYLIYIFFRFRPIFRKPNISIFNKISILLEQERIHRSF